MLRLRSISRSGETTGLTPLLSRLQDWLIQAAGDSRRIMVVPGVNGDVVVPAGCQVKVDTPSLSFPFCCGHLCPSVVSGVAQAVGIAVDDYDGGAMRR